MAVVFPNTHNSHVNFVGFMWLCRQKLNTLLLFNQCVISHICKSLCFRMIRISTLCLHRERVLCHGANILCHYSSPECTKLSSGLSSYHAFACVCIILEGSTGIYGGGSVSVLVYKSENANFAKWRIIFII